MTPGASEQTFAPLVCSASSSACARARLSRPALTAQYGPDDAMPRRPSPDEMCSTRRWPVQARVARRKAAVSTSGASRPTRAACDNSDQVSVCERRGLGQHRGVVDEARAREARRVEATEPCAESLRHRHRVGEIARPLLERRGRRLPRQAEHGGAARSELFGHRPAQAARRAGDDVEMLIHRARIARAPASRGDDERVASRQPIAARHIRRRDRRAVFGRQAPPQTIARVARIVLHIELRRQQLARRRV